MANRKWHRKVSVLEIGAGTITILISLTAVVLAGNSHSLGINFSQDFSLWFWSAEIGLLFIAFLAIFFAR